MPTDRHGFNTPSKGTPDWDTLLNDNFQKIDDLVGFEQAVGTPSSNNIDPSPEGKRYLDTDTGVIHIVESGAWVAKFIVGRFNPGSPGDEIVFGASTDDTVTINGEIDVTGKGIKSSASGTNALDAETTGNTAIQGRTDGEGWNAVAGFNSATSGWSWGVRGDTDSSDTNAFGVRGISNNGASKGVGGLSSGTTDGAAGVKGEATGGSGITFGVDGSTSSSNAEAAGVRGQTPEANYGVVGEAYDNESNLSSLASSESAGVFGRSDKTDGWGVAAYSNNNDAVFARTDDAASYALNGFNTGSDGYAVGAFGNSYVDGYQDVNDIGVSAWLGSNFTVPDSTATRVPFDNTVRDDFTGGLDTSTGVYEVQQPGDYHVDFLIDWSSTFASGDLIRYDLKINGSTSRGIAADTNVTGSTDPARGFSKAIFNLNQGDTIGVSVYQNSGAGMDIYGSGSSEETYLTIHKIG